MRLAKRFALDRPELRAWALYDWANSAMITVVVTAVYPIYFQRVVCDDPTIGAQRHALATTVSMIAVAVLGPVLGTWADAAGAKKRFLAAFLALGVASTAGLAFVGAGDVWLAAGLFGLANLGAATTFVFYDALLPSIARSDELDRVSTSAYALGYLGGGLVLALCLFAILSPEALGLPGRDDPDPARATLPTRGGFLFVAAWWALFSIPLFRRVAEPPSSPLGPRGSDAEPIARAGESRGVRAALETVLRLSNVWRELRRFPQAARMMLAFFAYNDGVGTVIRMAAVFATEMGLPEGVTIQAILLVQFAGIPFAFAFGQLAQRIGAKRSIFIGLGVYVTICVLAWNLDSEREFYAMAFLVAVVQGGVQALSRSLFASMIPHARSGEFFGLFSVLEKFAGVLGPAVFMLVLAATGSSRSGILALIVFFVVGGWLLARVDVDAGRRAVPARDDVRAGR